MARRLAIFDLNGTLKQSRAPHVCSHKGLGTWQATQVLDAQALAGQLDSHECLRLDAALWKGIGKTTMGADFRENRYIRGAGETARSLKEAGVWVGLVSTGLHLRLTGRG